jgi:hypothetical protein
MKIKRTWRLTPTLRLAILHDDQGRVWKAPLHLKDGRWWYRLIDVTPYVRGERGDV